MFGFIRNFRFKMYDLRCEEILLLSLNLRSKILNLKLTLWNMDSRLRGNDRVILSFRKAGLALLFSAILLSSNAQATGFGSSSISRNATLESMNMNRALNSIKNISRTDKKMVEKAKELEGVFLSIMMESMFPEGKESGLYGGSKGSGIFRTLMIQEYGMVLSNAGGVGLAAGIEKQLRNRGE